MEHLRNMRLWLLERVMRGWEVAYLWPALGSVLLLFPCPAPYGTGEMQNLAEFSLIFVHMHWLQWNNHPSQVLAKKMSSLLYQLQFLDSHRRLCEFFAFSWIFVGSFCILGHLADFAKLVVTVIILTDLAIRWFIDMRIMRNSFRNRNQMLTLAQHRRIISLF